MPRETVARPLTNQGAVNQHSFQIVRTVTLSSLTRAGIEDLSAKRDELHRQILQEEEEKQRVQHDISILTERLAGINEGLARKIAVRNDYDRTIAETEAAYKKVWE